jgi:hypothetical protein
VRVVHHTISIGCPREVNGLEGRRVVAGFYAELLGMRIIREDWLKVAKDVETLPHLAFSGDGWSDVRPPRWPDPKFPQQIHLDLLVADLDAIEARILELGGSRLDDRGGHRVYADPVGHPFCTYPAPAATEPAEIWRIVFDCPDPGTLARFYEQLVDEWERIEVTPAWVVLSPIAGDLPLLAFQQSQSAAPRWPDPAYPAQFHLDLSFDDEAAIDLARRLGATHLKGEVHADPAGHPFCLGIWRAAPVPSASSYARIDRGVIGGSAPAT